MGSRGEPRWCSYVFVFVFVFNAETECQCKLICSLDDDHVPLKRMMRPRGYSSMIGYGRAADTWKVEPFLYQILPKNETPFLIPRLTNVGGLLQPPLRFFPGRSKTLKKVTKGIIGNLFYILCGHFHEKKNLGYHLTWGRVKAVKVTGWGGGCNLFQFLDI